MPVFDRLNMRLYSMVTQKLVGFCLLLCSVFIFIEGIGMYLKLIKLLPKNYN